jgi:hypothetical protein
MSSATRAAVVLAEARAEREYPESRNPWDNIPNELDLDFSPRLASPTRRHGQRSWKSGDRVGVKEAIIRWLEEQM